MGVRRLRLCRAVVASGFALALPVAVASAGERLAGGRAAPELLRPSLDGTSRSVGAGVASGVAVLLPELRAGLGHSARRLLPNAFLHDRAMRPAPPDGTRAPRLPGRGIAGTARDDAAAGPDTVAVTVRSALRGSLETRRLLATARAAHAARHAAAMRFLPTVSATVEGEDLIDPAALTVQAARKRAVTGRLEASVPIFTSGVLVNEMQQARHLAAAADLNFVAGERKAALDAALAHVEVRLQRRVVAAVSGHRDALARVATIAKALFRAGEVSQTDVAIARANLSAVAADRADARRRLADAEAGFASLTGRAPPATLSLPRGAGFDSLEATVALAVRHSPALAAEQHGAQALAHAALAERGRFGPQVSGYANASRLLHHSSRTSPDLEYAMGVRLTVPLVAPSAVAAVSAAREEAIAARYGAMEAERGLRRRIVALWNGREAARRRAAAFRQQLSDVERTVEGTLREYRAGFRSIVDVLEAQVKRFQAVVARENAVHELAVAALRLDFATGQAGAVNHGAAPPERTRAGGRG